jgi:SAM-dependent methyltransferase
MSEFRYWDSYALPQFDFVPFAPGSQVLDVGCGEGEQLLAAEARGCTGVGVEPGQREPERHIGSHIRIVRGFAEHLPFDDSSFDGVVCKVVTPYTDEARAVTEIARVVRPGGSVVFCHQGAGYFLRYLLRPPAWKFSIYGARTLVNTVYYRLTGRRLPGFLGDSIFQSSARLRRYYDRVGLVVRASPASPTFLGAPVFIYEILDRTPVRSPATGRPSAT